MADEKKKNKLVQRFKVIQGGKIGSKEPLPNDEPIEPIGTPPISAPDFAQRMKDFDPEKVKAFDEVIKGLFKTLNADQPPKMFQCLHCGGFHSLDVNCEVCKGSTKAQQIFTMDRPDRMFAMAMCKQCLAVSVAIFECKGIDPKLAELQKEYMENMKAQQTITPDLESVPVEKDSNETEEPVE